MFGLFISFLVGLVSGRTSVVTLDAVERKRAKQADLPVIATGEPDTSYFKTFEQNQQVLLEQQRAAADKRFAEMCNCNAARSAAYYNRAIGELYAKSAEGKGYLARL